MRVLVVGGGGREHALAWRWLQDAPHDEVIVAPGNAGTAAIARNVGVDVTDARAVVRLARERSVDIVVIGPDAAAAAGVADACIADGIAVFGPTAAAARIESSKTFAKSIMDRAGVPTARWISGGADERSALRAFIAEHDGHCVVKADGLALGKGVVVCAGVDEAEAALTACLDDARFGAAGARVVVEERLTGSELSVFGISDGRVVRVLPPARDHKRAHDGDLGPNTGGMGAVAPAPDVDAPAVIEAAVRTVLQPCIDALRDAGAPFVGCLYAGLMQTGDGLKVLEYNARFGDPEAQVVLPLLRETAPDVFISAANGALPAGVARSAPGACVGIVAAAAGYPGTPRLGDAVTGVDAIDADVMCFHAGTRRDPDGTLRTSGGRVLAVCATGDDATGARERAYANLSRIRFTGMQYRSDIAALRDGVQAQEEVSA